MANYINEGELQTALKAHREGGPPEPLAALFIVMAEAQIVWWPNMPDQAEAVKNAAARCLQVYNKYSPGKGKAFNYFFTVIKQDFAKSLRAQVKAMQTGGL